MENKEKFTCGIGMHKKKLVSRSQVCTSTNEEKKEISEVVKECKKCGMKFVVKHIVSVIKKEKENNEKRKTESFRNKLKQPRPYCFRKHILYQSFSKTPQPKSLSAKDSALLNEVSKIFVLCPEKLNTKNKHIASNKKTDTELIKEDWEVVGDDLGKVMGIKRDKKG